MTSKADRMGLRHAPMAFTEQGIAMLSSVLNSERAIRVNIAIMRAFVRLREALSVHKELAAKLADVEHRIAGHDESVRTLYEAIRQLMARPEKPRPPVWFRVEEAAAGLWAAPAAVGCPETTTRVTTASGQQGGATEDTGEGHQHAEDEELKTDGQNFEGLQRKVSGTYPGGAGAGGPAARDRRRGPQARRARQTPPHES